MKFYDAHIHFFYECPLDELRHIFSLLETMGVRGIDVLVIAEYPDEIETFLKMIPGEYHPYVTPRSLENLRDPFLALNWPGHLRIVPFLDARFIENQIEQKIKMFRQRGFKGLKLLYVPEQDTEL